MNFALLLIMITGCAALLWWGCLGKGRIYEFPFLAGATFFGFILPQAVGLLREPGIEAGAALLDEGEMEAGRVGDRLQVVGRGEV